MDNTAVKQAEQQPTCLFTGDLLTPKTKSEHTILRALCGRIRTKRVSSNRFNEAAGRTVDKRLAETFAPLFSRIGGATPSWHKPPAIPATVAGDTGKFQFLPGGRFVRKGIAVEKDPRTGKPIAASAADPKVIKRKFGFPNVTAQIVPPTPSTPASIEVNLLNVFTEIAVLKSILLTFDHYLERATDRFTRRPELCAARELVRKFVMTGVLDTQSHDKIVLGLQYDKLDELQRLRKRLKAPITPFEHVMIVSANPATRTIDAIWWVASVDPYGFRLCSDWRGPAFTITLVNGVFKNGTAKFESVPDEICCRPQPLRRARVSSRTHRDQLDATVAEVAAFHRDALQRAMDYAERNCPDLVRTGVVHWAQFNLQKKKDGRILSGLISYLEVLFQWRLAHRQKRKAFDRVIKRRIRGIKQSMLREAVSSTTKAPAKIRWDRWHKLYIGILDDLSGKLGMAGEIGPGRSIVEISGGEK